MTPSKSGIRTIRSKRKTYGVLSPTEERVECPQCGSKKGERCTGPQGNPTVAHAARRALEQVRAGHPNTKLKALLSKARGHFPGEEISCPFCLVDPYVRCVEPSGLKLFVSHEVRRLLLRVQSGETHLQEELENWLERCPRKPVTAVSQDPEAE